MASSYPQIQPSKPTKHGDHHEGSISTGRANIDGKGRLWLSSRPKAGWAKVVSSHLARLSCSKVQSTVCHLGSFTVASSNICLDLPYQPPKPRGIPERLRFLIKLILTQMRNHTLAAYAPDSGDFWTMKHRLVTLAATLRYPVTKYSNRRRFPNPQTMRIHGPLIVPPNRRQQEE